MRVQPILTCDRSLAPGHLHWHASQDGTRSILVAGSMMFDLILNYPGYRALIMTVPLETARSLMRTAPRDRAEDGKRSITWTAPPRRAEHRSR